VQRGRDPRDFTLFAFGGSGPIHAAGIARELGIRRILVPPRPGVFSAVGLLLARLEGHAKRTWLRRTGDLDRDELDAQLDELERDARDALGPDILGESPFEFETWAEMRYVGQGFELPVQLPPRKGDWQVWRRLLDATFEDEHERTYGHRTGNPTEVVHLRVVSREAVPPAFPAGAPPSDRSRADRGTSERFAYFGGANGPLRTPILRRGDLTAEPRGGPIVIEDYDATTVVPPDFTVHADDEGNLVLEIA
jgi:N-methylhydantoinase A